jgi:membrane protease YdiL (CAAX protease family)
MADFSTVDIRLAITIGYATMATIAMWILMTSPVLIRYFHGKYGDDEGNLRQVFFGRFLSAFVLGVPLTLIALFVWEMTPEQIGLTVKKEYALEMTLWLTLCLVINFIMIWPSRRKQMNHQAYPTVRRLIWSRKLVGTYMASWGIYLFGYELLYRGLLFFICVEHMGVLTASVINIAIYAATHAYKGYIEVFGSIAAGLAMCALVYRTESFLPGFILHLQMSWINFVLVYRNRRKVRAEEYLKAGL